MTFLFIQARVASGWRLLGPIGLFYLSCFFLTVLLSGFDRVFGSLQLYFPLDASFVIHSLARARHLSHNVR